MFDYVEALRVERNELREEVEALKDELERWKAMFATALAISREKR